MAFDIVSTTVEKEPLPDIAKCSKCGWKGSVDKCETDSEGDWETGYYNIHLCPKCEDGGCVDDYSMSKKRAKEWNLWYAKKNPVSKLN